MIVVNVACGGPATPFTVTLNVRSSDVRASITLPANVPDPLNRNGHPLVTTLRGSGAVAVWSTPFASTSWSWMPVTEKPAAPPTRIGGVYRDTEYAGAGFANTWSTGMGTRKWPLRG